MCLCWFCLYPRDLPISNDLTGSVSVRHLYAVLCEKPLEVPGFTMRGQSTRSTPRLAGRLGSSGPGVSVGLQSHSLDPKARASLLELRGAVFAVHSYQIREQRALVWQLTKDPRCSRSEMDNGRLKGFPVAKLPPEVALGLVPPIHVLTLEHVDVALLAPEIPAQLVKKLPLRVELISDDPLVFLQSYSSLGLKFHRWPLALGDHRGEEPAHIEGEVVDSPKKDVCGNGAGGEGLEEILGRGLDQSAPKKVSAGVVLDRCFPPLPRGSSISSPNTSPQVRLTSGGCLPSDKPERSGGSWTGSERTR